MHDHDDASIDSFISQQLPDWLRTAPLPLVQTLRQSLHASQQAQAPLKALLDKVEPIEAFAEPLLSAAMTRQFGSGLAINVRTWRFRLVRRILDTLPSGALPSHFRVVTTYQSLLHAALHNFDAEGSLAHRTDIVDAHGKVQGVSVSAFVTLCRELDLGGKYQAHLKALFTPAGEPARQVRNILTASMRSNLAVALSVACIKGDLDSATHDCLLRSLALKPLVPNDTLSTFAHHLNLLGKRMVAMVAFEVREQLFEPNRFSGLHHVVLYVPDDPLLPVKQYASWDELYSALATRLLEPGYPGFIQRFVGEADRSGFVHTLQRLLGSAKGGASIELDGRHTAFAGALLDTLCSERIGKIEGDARVLAVPTDDEDRAVRAARLQEYLDVGLTLANLTAFFVPGLAEVMLGVAVGQMLGELYHGYEDWQQGDRESALNHLMGVAENVAANALLLAGGKVLVKVLERSRFVDGLVPVGLPDGRSQLWKPDLQPYRAIDDSASVTLPGIAESPLLVSRHADSGQWHVHHPQRAEAYTPRLEPVGGGAWRHSWDSPQHWQGSAAMLKRFGGNWATADERLLSDVLAITGTREAQVRQWHVQGSALPATMDDCLQRAQVDRQLASVISGLKVGNVHLHPPLLLRTLAGMDTWPPSWVLRLGDGVFSPGTVQLPRYIDLKIASSGAGDWLDQLLAALTGDDKAGLLTTNEAGLSERQALIGQLVRRLEQAPEDSFDYLYSQAQGEASAGARVLQRNFPGMPRVLADELLAQARPDTLQTLLDTAQLPLAIAEEARSLMHELRINRALEGFYLDNIRAASSTRLVEGLLAQLQGWPPEHALPSAMVRQTAVGWFQTLVDGLSGEQQAELGLHSANPAADLRHRLATLAVAQRNETARLIGLSEPGAWFKPPQRLADGRIGYPLSGRGIGARQAVNAAVRELYPTFSDAEISEFLTELRVSGRELWSGLQALQQELAALNETLYSWQAADPLRGASRERVAARLRRCWRRQSARVRNRGADYRLLLLEDEAIGALPELPDTVSFAHVAEVTLNRLQISEVPATFFQRFPGLRWLDIAGSNLTGVPQSLTGMEHLTWLNLSRNQINWTAADNSLLASLPRLEVLDLDQNPLRAQPDVTALPRLRRLRLRNTQITGVPHGLLSRPALESADLRENPIVILHEGLFNAPRRILERINFHDNPLNAESRERLLAFERAGLLPAVAGFSHSSFDNLREEWLSGSGAELLGLRSQQWQALQGEAGSADLFRLLGDLRETSDFRRQRQNLSARVWQVLDGCYRNSALRAELFELAGRPRSCSDSVALNFSALETRAHVLGATTGLPPADRQQALLNLARALFRVDEVDRLSAEEIQIRRSMGMVPDEIEVLLAYRTGLAAPLGLVGQPATMEYRFVAGVDSTALERMRDQVRLAERTPRFAASIAQRDFWVEFLEQHYRAEFEAADQPFYEQVEALEATRNGLTDQLYLQRMNGIGAARESARAALVERLTAMALQREVGAPTSRVQEDVL